VGLEETSAFRTTVLRDEMPTGPTPPFVEQRLCEYASGSVVGSANPRCGTLRALPDLTRIIDLFLRPTATVYPLSESLRRN